MEKEQLKNKVKELMEKVLVATLATNNGKNSWVANLFYVNDKDLNIYFLSGTKTRHSQEAVANQNVAISIYDKECDYNLVHGLQIEGELQVANLPEVVIMMKQYVEKYPDSIKKLKDPKELVSDLSESRLYKVVPKRVVYMNSSLKTTEGTSRFEILS